MIYNLFTKKLGTNNIELIKKIETEDAICDLCYIDDFGFVFPHGNSIGLLDLKGDLNLKFIQRLNNPISLCYSHYRSTCFIFDNDGKGVKYFQHNSDTVVPFLGTVYQAKLNSTLLNKKGVQVEGAQMPDGDIYVVNNQLHKCLRFSESEFHIFAGVGTEGYASSNDIIGCLFSSPSGIAYCNKTLYITDTSNHCIRTINNKQIKLVAGSPMEQGDRDGLNALLDAPRKIRVEGGIGSFIDNDKVKQIALSNGDVKTIYGSDNIISIELDSKKNLYILEGEMV